MYMNINVFNTTPFIGKYFYLTCYFILFFMLGYIRKSFHYNLMCVCMCEREIVTQFLVCI